MPHRACPYLSFSAAEVQGTTGPRNSIKMAGYGCRLQQATGGTAIQAIQARLSRRFARPGYRASTNRPAVPRLQFAHPAGDLSEDTGKNAFFVAESTAMECALFPVGNWVTSVCVEASII